MLAVDTNVVVRYITRDHPEQSARTKWLIDNNEVFVATTVLLEIEWVLRSAYGFGPAQIARALGDFAGLPHVTLEDPAVAAQAVEWLSQGMDFADALHLAGTAHCEKFVSFDRRLATAAARIGRTVRPP